MTWTEAATTTNGKAWRLTEPPQTKRDRPEKPPKFFCDTNFWGRYIRSPKQNTGCHLTLSHREFTAKGWYSVEGEQSNGTNNHDENLPSDT